MTFIRNFITCIFSIIQISMRTIEILLMLLLTASQSALAFNQKIDTVVVANDSCEIVQFIVTIDNTDSEALWIWLDSNDYGHDRKKAIRRYLMKRRGDFSIFDIGAAPQYDRGMVASFCAKILLCQILGNRQNFHDCIL